MTGLNRFPVIEFSGNDLTPFHPIEGWVWNRIAELYDIFQVRPLHGGDRLFS